MKSYFYCSDLNKGHVITTCSNPQNNLELPSGDASVNTEALKSINPLPHKGWNCLHSGKTRQTNLKTPGIKLTLYSNVPVCKETTQQMQCSEVTSSSNHRWVKRGHCTYTSMLQNWLHALEKQDGFADEFVCKESPMCTCVFAHTCVRVTQWDGWGEELE